MPRKNLKSFLSVITKSVSCPILLQFCRVFFYASGSVANITLLVRSFPIRLKKNVRREYHGVSKVDIEIYFSRYSLSSGR